MPMSSAMGSCVWATAAQVYPSWCDRTRRRPFHVECPRFEFRPARHILRDSQGSRPSGSWQPDEVDLELCRVLAGPFVMPAAMREAQSRHARPTRITRFRKDT